ncbi:hypothetical protein DL96DRAFT_1684804 [Flagelloscypha sp. PMI_526]|nr:hypothetical protein DL96DRAFT_1684804 [Flagelloscypha sp. PMI_526]
MHLVELPLDILNRLMELVDRQSLLSCALSCRVLRSPSQRMLFAWTSFPPYWEISVASEGWKQFCESLDTTGDLGQHVRTLTVRAVLLTDQTIASVFSKTRNLSNLGIEGERIRGPRMVRTEMPWLNLQPQTCHFLLQDVFPRLITLRLWNLESIPAIIIESLASIEHLECADHITPLPENFTPGPLSQSIGKPHPLRRLDLARSWDSKQAIGYTPLASYFRRHGCRLREISLTQFNINEELMGLSTMHSLGELLAPSRTSLQALAFQGPDSFITHIRDEASYKKWFQGIYDLGQYPALTTFIINFLLDYPDELEITISQYIQRIVDILHSGRPTASSAGLRIVAINAEFEAGVGDQKSWWHPIVRALSTIPTLQKIYFKIDVSPFYDNQSKEIHNASKSVLEEVLKGEGLLEKSEISLGDDDPKWSLSTLGSLT